MMKNFLPYWSLLVLVLLANCASYPVPRYSVSVQNVQQFKKFSNAISVQQVSWKVKGSRDNFQCRAAGPIETSEKTKFEDYIKKALSDEIALADKLDDAGIPLSIIISYMDVSTTSSHWEIKSNVKFGNAHFEHNSLTQFEGGFIADNACRNAANSYIAAVQDYIKSMIPKLQASLKSNRP